MVTIEVRNMSYRALLVGTVLAAGLAGFASADMVAVDNGIAVKESDVTAPTRGMTMSQVASKFGEPVSKVAAVGKPPISRWEYPGFVVYFEHDHVIHSVVSAEAPAPAPPASSESTAASSESTAATSESAAAPAASAPARAAASAPAAAADAAPAPAN